MTPEQCRGVSRRRPRRTRLLIGLAVALTATVACVHEVSAERPTEVAGDPHSPQVARLATVALEARARFDAKGLTSDGAAYLEALSNVAHATAAELGVSGARLSAAWLATSDRHQLALLTALTQLGAPYRSNTSDPEQGFDCSGLTAYAWGHAGVQLARQSGAQISAADPRDAATARAGDLAQYPGHVAIYLGVPRAFVHAANPEDDVELWLTSEDRAASLSYGDPTA